jgi:hypothetical protein
MTIFVIMSDASGTKKYQLDEDLLEANGDYDFTNVKDLVASCGHATWTVKNWRSTARTRRRLRRSTRWGGGGGR